MEKKGNHEMKASVESYAKPESCYSQKYDQAPLNYVDRQNRIQGKEAYDK